MKVIILSLAIVFAIPAVASAESTDDLDRFHELPATQADEPRLTFMDFEGDDIQGGVLGPMESQIRGSNERPLGSLIQIRTDFIDEMLISVDAI